MTLKSDALAMYDDAIDKAKSELKASETRVEFLKGQLERLQEIRKQTAAILIAADDSSGPAVRRTRTPSVAKPDLPKTDRGFWLALVTNQPQGTNEILKAAQAKLSIKDEEGEKVALLKQRQTAALTKLIDEKAIDSEGEQQKRKFFLPKKA